MSKYDAHMGLTDTVRIVREADLRLHDDPLEQTQRMGVDHRRLAANTGWLLHQEWKRAQPFVVEERRAYPHDFRDGRPRGDLTDMQRALQDLKGDEDY
jgi:hypothetical protein